MHSRLLVGLTGGIASGKTTVSDYLDVLGAYVIDTDIISREVVAVGSLGLTHVTTRFGEHILATDGSLNRQKLRGIIFDDAQARKDLNAILHPLIEQSVKEKIQIAPTGAPYILIAIPLLVETSAKAKYRLHRVLVIDIQEEIQMQRLCSREGITPDVAKQMIEAQASRSARLAVADDVIDNSGTLDQLKKQTRIMHDKYLEIAQFAKLHGG